MGLVRKEEQLLLPMALGARFVEELREHPAAEVALLATDEDAKKVLDAVQYVMAEPPIGAFMHSWLCAMSLPATRPKGDAEFETIVRRDGNHTLIIKPGTKMKMVDGELVETSIGVPYGPLARIIMIYIMTQAVKTKKPHIFLGNSLSAFLRRMGIGSVTSGGPRGTRSLVLDQLERLMACQFTFRKDSPAAVEIADEGRGAKRKGGKAKQVRAFAVSDVRMVTHYGGVSEGKNEFVCEFVLSDVFFDNLVDHAVPFNERAIAAIRSSATQLDLYTFLAMRLPRIQDGEEVILTWEQLKVHLGNDSKNLFKFRQTVRKAWATVSGVYPQARGSVSFDELRIRLRHAEAPVDNQPTLRRDGTVYLASLRDSEGEVDVTAPVTKTIRFPASGSIRFGHPEIYAVARHYGSNNDVDHLADCFRRAVGSNLKHLEGEDLLSRFKAYVEKFSAPH